MGGKITTETLWISHIVIEHYFWAFCFLQKDAVKDGLNEGLLIMSFLSRSSSNDSLRALRQHCMWAAYLLSFGLFAEGCEGQHKRAFIESTGVVSQPGINEMISGRTKVQSGGGRGEGVRRCHNMAIIV